MRFLIGLLRFLGAPVFFVMAWLTWALQTKAPAMPGMDMSVTQAVKLYGVSIDPHLNMAINSWWLMYVLMGVFCLPSWLGLLAGKTKS